MGGAQHRTGVNFNLPSTFYSQVSLQVCRLRLSEIELAFKGGVRPVAMVLTRRFTQ